jgi:hypothetical protein
MKEGSTDTQSNHQFYVPSATLMRSRSKEYRLRLKKDTFLTDTQTDDNTKSSEKV